MGRTAAEHLTFTFTAAWAANRGKAERQRRAVARAAAVFQTLFDRFGPEQLERIAEGVQEVLSDSTADPDRVRFVQEFTGMRAYSPTERTALRLETLARSFAQRDDLLREALTAPDVARLLGVSRQTPHDRVESGSLLAVLDRGALRFPPWQFDPNGPDRVVAGLPAVIRALRMPPLAKINWLTRPNPYLEGRRPIDALRQGEVERVLDNARGTGPK
ncbi:MAG: DUF2384 domain-containing protein [Chloroflexi bacterium]|nr:DUF2384 domain-containing protein [Chloroflexota bacterium]